MSTVDERIAYLFNQCETAWWYLKRLEKQIAQVSAGLPLPREVNMGTYPRPWWRARTWGCRCGQRRRRRCS
jgi:hypothetical protein